MAQPKVILKRRKAVDNIKKITSTMELIATSRFKRAFDRATGTKPYATKISELVAGLSGVTGGEITHKLLQVNQGTGRSVVLVITSNRGLCGGYNANILSLARSVLKEEDEQGRNVELRVAGKKGLTYFRYHNRSVDKEYTQFEDKPAYEEVASIADELIEAYELKRIDAVKVVYMQFHSMSKQAVGAVSLLPISSLEQYDSAPTAAGGSLDEYIFTESPASILQALVPATVKTALFQCFIEAAVSEQIARMVAMKAASDNATEMGKQLTREYNRARQGKITNELLDIVGGAEALSG